MTTRGSLGIWMDHSNAHLTEFTVDPMKTIVHGSDFSHADKEQALSKNENLMHNKEQHQQAKYYKQLGEKIINYDEVVLFGPTNAKAELFNFLKADHRFEKVKITVKQTDKMTEHEQQDFVREHFAKH